MTRTATLATALLLLTAVAGACRVNAQTPMERAVAEASSAMQRPNAATASTEPTSANDSAVTAMPASPSETILGDPATRTIYLRAMQQYYEYRTSGYLYRSRVFEWQLLSSRVIFGVVLLLVATGIYFASVQFRIAMRAMQHPASEAAAVTVPDVVVPLATKLELSAKGISINSSVMGIVILALSLAFFYLYLVYVYPIRDVF